MHWCLASRNGFLWQYGWALVQLGVLPIGYQKRYVALTMLLRGIVMAATSLKILAFIWGVGYGVQNNSELICVSNIMCQRLYILWANTQTNNQIIMYITGPITAWKIF